MAVLVTGGAGYIGSHTAIELLEDGYEVVIADNLSNSSADSIDRIEKITGKRPVFYQVDLCDEAASERIFQEHKIDSVIHFAGYKAVGESVEKPLMYYENNVGNTLTILKLMDKYAVKSIIFSSSATVYGQPKEFPLLETFSRSALSPYANTKIIIEDILTDYHKTRPDSSVIILRYFNPVGAHKSHLIGENPRGIPNNLMPFITKVAVGELELLRVFGNDYDTPDGTCIRDYIHVVDLANGHIAALKRAQETKGLDVYNLGTGKGTSVLEMIEAFIRVNDIDINYQIVGRRSGDVPILLASAKKAKAELGWRAKLTIEDMVNDSYLWQLKSR